jgi:hypothetical protein
MEQEALRQTRWSVNPMAVAETGGGGTKSMQDLIIASQKNYSLEFLHQVQRTGMHTSQQIDNLSWSKMADVYFQGDESRAIKFQLDNNMLYYDE